MRTHKIIPDIGCQILVSEISREHDPPQLLDQMNDRVPARKMNSLLCHQYIMALIIMRNLCNCILYLSDCCLIRFHFIHAFLFNPSPSYPYCMEPALLCDSFSPSLTNNL